MTGTALADTYKEVEERKAYYPDQYKGFGPTVDTAAQLIRPEAHFHMAQFSVAPLMGFRAAQRTCVFSKPVLVKTYKDDDIFFVENDTLVLCGRGASRDEAILDFTKHLDYFYNFYKRQSESNLIGDGLRLKKIYDNLFVDA